MWRVPSRNLRRSQTDMMTSYYEFFARNGCAAPTIFGAGDEVIPVAESTSNPRTMPLATQSPTNSVLILSMMSSPNTLLHAPPKAAAVSAGISPTAATIKIAPPEKRHTKMDPAPTRISLAHRHSCHPGGLPPYMANIAGVGGAEKPNGKATRPSVKSPAIPLACDSYW